MLFSSYSGDQNPKHSSKKAPHAGLKLLSSLGQPETTSYHAACRSWSSVATWLPLAAAYSRRCDSGCLTAATTGLLGGGGGDGVLLWLLLPPEQRDDWQAITLLWACALCSSTLACFPSGALTPAGSQRRHLLRARAWPLPAHACERPPLFHSPTVLLPGGLSAVPLSRRLEGRARTLQRRGSRHPAASSTCHQEEAGRLSTACLSPGSPCFYCVDSYPLQAIHAWQQY